ncbi:uncharacterized protein FOMMEDRAFT_28031 [Fomitiporia mediterranea MF3/22]|uniref:uncharacterized protein n=1 Tax=Fomitiporia mediterranea (strain MF3/22) TaxID=694068 RepID=UPI000440749B|nr:uncharacterized protein FOMMEDRAFT_28031 [Fomitiporia mediterranea MF3/22]EJD04298.1 hypothetical protein FOMMEDRAFT_28031 [Fomitiporia mediterranea MF3/22]
MYNYPTHPAASPTNTASSSGHSEQSAVSTLWSTDARQTQSSVLHSSHARPPHTPSRYVALSTQYVYAAPQRTPMLAQRRRVSIVEYRGIVIYDKFVRPTHQIEDFRPSVTGLLAEHLSTSEALYIVRQEVSALLRDKTIVGHSLWMHFSLLGITHPAIHTRDVALYLPFHRSIRSSTVTPLKSLVSHLMRRKIGRSHEHPLEEARAALDLFRSYEEPWEDEIRGGGWPSALPPSSYSRFFS